MKQVKTHTCIPHSWPPRINAYLQHGLIAWGSILLAVTLFLLPFVLFEKSNVRLGQFGPFLVIGIFPIILAAWIRARMGAIVTSLLQLSGLYLIIFHVHNAAWVINVDILGLSSTALGFMLVALITGQYSSMSRKLAHSHNEVMISHAELSKAYKAIEQQALTDPLTNLPNHGAIIDRIEAEIVQCSTSQQNCAIIFVDIDYFKRINDTWGHAAGDAALFTVGQRLRQDIRATDYVGRYGGEEFAVLLTDIGQDEAAKLAERLRLSIADTPCLWQHDKTQESVSIPLTASFGVAIYPLDGTSGKELLEMADTAMYIAKRTGRNQVCLPDAEQAAQLIANESPELALKAERNMTQMLSTVGQLRDQDTYDHAHRMTDMVAATARQMGRSEEEITLIRLAAQLHDIGKIGVPDAILHKPGSLTQEEWGVMRCHPQTSQQLLVQAGGRFELISHIVVAHHERWDGSGYPYQLSQEQIPLGARILSVVDSYDAMTSSRPYRETFTTEQAQAELLRCSGSQFDPQVVEAFLRELRGERSPRNFVEEALRV